ncbi:efflux RND transporter periplasmic adaptor subunit [Jannaschia ovalis]|uniref:Efflux RND transporter periplasmic adaptor subunit n=1 Tax=Jannaschia ovalis TaxID=3038773 RepID=A0ABY8LIP5_9RHOB|nr:efflux RND transporter periplasmic adaptor subunit [Jannaschia sp. GRR-S6-38]WGH79978.1 efflux RND transporter periplasmic adaptor subunit [Jannaschia sp. GRR-S6-38]
MANKTDDRGGSAWLWFLAGLVVLGLGGAGYWWLSRPAPAQETQPPPPPLIEAATVEDATRFAVRQTAFLRPKGEVPVAPEITARITEVAPEFDAGRRVAEGTVLIRLDPTRIKAERAAARARVAEARAAVTEARIEAERQRELEERGVVAEAVLQATLVALASAEAALETARADAALAADRLRDTEIRAPFEALVVAADADPGDLAPAGQPVGVLAPWDAAEAELGLVPNDLPLLPELDALRGALVRVLSDGPAGIGVERPIAEGTVTAIGPQILDGTRTLPLIVTIPDPFAPGADAPPGARPLRLGELLTLEMPVEIEGAGAVALPARALKPGGIVWRIADGALEATRPELLRRETVAEGERVILRAGPLQPGDRVLLSELPEAAEGQAVRLPDGG